MTVAGHGSVATNARTARITGRTVNWLTGLDQPQSITVSTPHD